MSAPATFPLRLPWSLGNPIHGDRKSSVEGLVEMACMTGTDGGRLVRVLYDGRTLGIAPVPVAGDKDEERRQVFAAAESILAVRSTSGPRTKTWTGILGNDGWFYESFPILEA